MKKLLFLLLISIIVAGCVPVSAQDDEIIHIPIDEKDWPKPPEDSIWKEQPPKPEEGITVSIGGIETAGKTIDDPVLGKSIKLPDNVYSAGLMISQDCDDPRECILELPVLILRSIDQEDAIAYIGRDGVLVVETDGARDLFKDVVVSEVKNDK